jgi:hypothetical protein
LCLCSTGKTKRKKKSEEQGVKSTIHTIVLTTDEKYNKRLRTYIGKKFWIKKEKVQRAIGGAETTNGKM